MLKVLLGALIPVHSSHNAASSSALMASVLDLGNSKDMLFRGLVPEEIRKEVYSPLEQYLRNQNCC